MSNYSYIKNKCSVVLKLFHDIAHTPYLEVISNRFPLALQTWVLTCLPQEEFHN